ncbi:hypothetical protein CTI14_55555, partial [Methylobacterium radiotolerans]
RLHPERRRRPPRLAGQEAHGAALVPVAQRLRRHLAQRSRREALANPSAGIRRYGSNEFTNATSGAVALNKVTGAVLDGVAFTQNAGGGLLGWQAKKLTVRHSFLSLNGFDG